MLYSATPTELLHNIALSERMPNRQLCTPYFFSLGDGDSLETILERPYSAFVEIARDEKNSKLEAFLESLQVNVPDISFSLTTLSCYNNSTAQAISRMINERFGLYDDRVLQVQTCLQEAIMNSIIHGNLGIDGKFKSVDDFEEYNNTIRERISSSRYKYKRIETNIWAGDSQLKISVSDEGSGFSMPDDDDSDGGNAPSGRGLLFIRTLSDRAWVGEDGRTLNMVFNY